LDESEQNSANILKNHFNLAKLSKNLLGFDRINKIYDTKQC